MPNGAAAPIYSTLGADLDLGELVEMFVEEIPNRAQALGEAVERRDWLETRRLAHQLKGAAGSYGFEAVTPLAARLELSASQADDEE